MSTHLMSMDREIRRSRRRRAFATTAALLVLPTFVGAGPAFAGHDTPQRSEAVAARAKVDNTCTPTLTAPRPVADNPYARSVKVYIICTGTARITSGSAEYGVQRLEGTWQRAYSATRSVPAGGSWSNEAKLGVCIDRIGNVTLRGYFTYTYSWKATATSGVTTKKGTAYSAQVTHYCPQ